MLTALVYRTWFVLISCLLIHKYHFPPQVPKQSCMDLEIHVNICRNYEKAAFTGVESISAALSRVGCVHSFHDCTDVVCRGIHGPSVNTACVCARTPSSVSLFSFPIELLHYVDAAPEVGRSPALARRSRLHGEQCA